MRLGGGWIGGGGCVSFSGVTMYQRWKWIIRINKENHTKSRVFGLGRGEWGGREGGCVSLCGRVLCCVVLLFLRGGNNCGSTKEGEVGGGKAEGRGVGWGKKVKEAFRPPPNFSLPPLPPVSHAPFFLCVFFVVCMSKSMKNLTESLGARDRRKAVPCSCCVRGNDNTLTFTPPPPPTPPPILLPNRARHCVLLLFFFFFFVSFFFRLCVLLGKKKKKKNEIITLK